MGKFTDDSFASHWTPYIIEYKGIMDLEGLYRLIIRWLQSRSYEFHEKTYKHKPCSGGVGKEQEWKMEAWKKVNDYIRYWFDIYSHVWDMLEVDVIKDGQKVKMIDGRIRILIKTKLDRDWQGRWDKTRTMKRLRGFYDKYVTYKDATGPWGDMLHYKIVKLQNEIKMFLGMETPARVYYHYMGPDQIG
jgi:hypothetical protein